MDPGVAIYLVYTEKFNPMLSQSSVKLEKTQ